MKRVNLRDFSKLLQLPCLLVGVFFCFQASAAELIVNFLYVEQTHPPISGLASTLRAPDDQGLKGVELGVIDSNSTGKFLKHQYQMQSIVDGDTEQLLKKTAEWLSKAEHNIVIANVDSDTLFKLHKLTNQQAIVFNIAVTDDALRQNQCTTGLLHTTASRAMLADALIQFINYKRWKKLLLIQGEQPQDKLFTAAIKRAIARFGAGKIIAEKNWTFDTDLRRVAQKEIPLFTQYKDYDVVLVSDEIGYFANYLPYNTWLPRPVAGSAGMMPVIWHRSVEQWGAIQLQNRFYDLSKRWMNGVDYAAWAAVRSIAEAVTRTQNIDANTLYQYMLGDEFELAAFKGRKLSYRQWNGQMRQPIALVHPKGLITQAPQEGYLHPESELDTLGYDKAETQCDFKTTLTKQQSG